MQNPGHLWSIIIATSQCVVCCASYSHLGFFFSWVFIMYLCDFSLPESLDVRESHFHSLSVWILGPQEVGKSYCRLRVLWDPRVGMEESLALRCLKPPQGQLCNGTQCCLTAVKKWKASISSVVWLNHGFVLTNWYDNFVINNHLLVVYALKKMNRAKEKDANFATICKALSSLRLCPHLPEEDNDACLPHLSWAVI